MKDEIYSGSVENRKERSVHDEPEIYSGIVTKKWNKDALPVCILAVSFILFVIAGFAMSYERTMGRSVTKVNFFYQISEAGSITFLSGSIILVFMLAAFVCYKLHLYGWALGVQTCTVVFFGWMISVAFSVGGKVADLKFLEFVVMFCALVNEIAMIWAILIARRQRKGR